MRSIDASKDLQIYHGIYTELGKEPMQLLGTWFTAGTADPALSRIILEYNKYFKI
jgi:hypothetical protein